MRVNFFFIFIIYYDAMSPYFAMCTNILHMVNNDLFSFVSFRLRPITLCKVYHFFSLSHMKTRVNSKGHDYLTSNKASGTEKRLLLTDSIHKRTHTHTHIYIYTLAASRSVSRKCVKSYETKLHQ